MDLVRSLLLCLLPEFFPGVQDQNFEFANARTAPVPT